MREGRKSLVSPEAVRPPLGAWGGYFSLPAQAGATLSSFFSSPCKSLTKQFNIASRDRLEIGDARYCDWNRGPCPGGLRPSGDRQSRAHARGVRFVCADRSHRVRHALLPSVLGKSASSAGYYFASPLPWGEAGLRNNPGEGVQYIDRSSALTPTLSPRERELIAVVATSTQTSVQQNPVTDRFVARGTA